MKTGQRVVIVKLRVDEGSFHGKIGRTGTIKSVYENMNPMYGDCSILWDGEPTATFGYYFDELTELS